MHLFSQFDNTLSDIKSIAPSFLYSVNGKRVLYTYIRKNACTAFKHLFRELYQLWQDSSYQPAIGELSKAIGVRPDDIKSGEVEYDVSVFIYRDPIDRALSAFKNKLIQQNGADDFIRTVDTYYDKPFGKVSFASFVTDYLAALTTDNWQAVDGHMYPQRWHLLPIKYTHAVDMDLLYESMLEIFPYELVDKVFRKPVNVTGKGGNIEHSVDHHTPVATLIDLYEQDGFLPSRAALVTPELEAKLKHIYQGDYDMLPALQSL